MLRVGGAEVDTGDAREWVRQYLNGSRGQYGYPSYDGYRTNDDPNRLADGDLLAPVLLNVRMKISSFADLCARRDDLESALTVVPLDIDLTDADDGALTSVGRLFAVLDSELRPRSVLGTTLAKVLHRKRPRLVPLYDKNVSRVYQDGEAAPLPVVVGRPWPEFMRLLAGFMRDDLNRAPDIWDELRALTPEGGPPISRLRALDIVAWNLGDKS